MRDNIDRRENNMRCQRCRGCMVRDHFMDVLNVSGEMDFEGWRCLNCGDITDPVIVRHHQSPPTVSARPKRRWSEVSPRAFWLVNPPHELSQRVNQMWYETTGLKRQARSPGTARGRSNTRGHD